MDDRLLQLKAELGAISANLRTMQRELDDILAFLESEMERMAISKEIIKRHEFINGFDS